MPNAKWRMPKGLLITGISVGVVSALAWPFRENTSRPASVLAPAPVARVQLISFAEARPVIEAHAGELPAALRANPGTPLESAWPAWTAAHDAAIRARLIRGDEDSVVNFWLYGTGFTSQPRATLADLGRRGPAKTEDLLIARLNDLVAAMADPGSNERLRFARQTVERHGISLSTAEGQDRARELLVSLRERMIVEAKRHDREARPDTFATIYRERGLSSDTSLAVNFALDRALAEAKAKGHIATGSVKRIAIVGPGLDFTDKAEGYDVYPVQTIQPFALVDSLVRLGLGDADTVSIATFDLSPRVNEHLRSAAARGRNGEPYVLQLPLARDDPSHTWEPALEEYWKTCGGGIGQVTTPVSVPAAAGRVDLRAVSVRPAVAAAVRAEDVNVVVQRLTPFAEAQRFDVIVATNVLVYYDRFEQGLALANIGSMLRPGGIFLTNYEVNPPAPLESTAGLVTPVFWDRQKNGDTIYGYRYVVNARRQ